MRDQILERPTILVPGCPETFLDIVTDFPNLGNLRLKKPAKTFPWCLRTYGIVKFPNETEDFGECDIHHGTHR